MNIKMQKNRLNTKGIVSNAISAIHESRSFEYEPSQIIYALFEDQSMESRRRSKFKKRTTNQGTFKELTEASDIAKLGIFSRALKIVK